MSYSDSEDKIVWENMQETSNPRRDEEGGEYLSDERKQYQGGSLHLHFGNQLLPWREPYVWVAHTNFRLDDDVAKRVYLMAGVEFAERCSPYRLAIGIGKAFDVAIVQATIEEMLLRKVDRRVDNLIDLLHRIRQHPYWVLGVSSDGKLSPFGGKDIDAMKMRMTLCQKTGGVITCKELANSCS